MSEAERFSFYSLALCDRSSGMFVKELYLEQIDRGALSPALQARIETLAPNSSCELSAQDISEIFPLDGEFAQRTNLTPILLHDAPLSPYRVHGGREFDLLTKGVKPLAVFSAPTTPEVDFLNRFFEPMTATGALIGEQWGEDDGADSWRTFLYALPGEEWRISAYDIMKRAARRAGWSDGLESVEGALLGYTEQQNDLWAAYRKRTGMRWGLSRFLRIVDDGMTRRVRETGGKAFLPEAQPTVRLYQPHGEPDAAAAALRTLGSGRLARFYAPLRRLHEHSVGVVDIDGEPFGVYDLPTPSGLELNALVDGEIEML